MTTRIDVPPAPPELVAVEYWADEARAATAARNDAIVAAHAGGRWSLRMVADVAGLSHSAVAKIVAHAPPQ